MLSIESRRLVIKCTDRRLLSRDPHSLVKSRTLVDIPRQKRSVKKDFGAEMPSPRTERRAQPLRAPELHYAKLSTSGNFAYKYVARKP